MIKVKSSAIMPIKSSHAMVEIRIETDGEAVSETVSLNKSYKSIQVLSVGVLNRKSVPYTGAVAVQTIDNDTSSVAITAPAVANTSPLITITLVCEV